MRAPQVRVTRTSVDSLEGQFTNRSKEFVGDAGKQIL